MNKSLLIGGPGSLEDSIPALARSLFRGDLTTDQIRTISVQNLYFAIKEIGLESSLDILDVISKKQYEALLDFELWTKDSFREDRFWEWLGVIDDEKDLTPIQKFLSSVDSPLLAYIIRKYVEVVYHEEPDDYPPGPNFYTPDQGSTWICIKTHDANKHRLCGKLLAFLYQTNIDFFYRLLLQSYEGTSIEFEELGFNEKSKRLEVENIPDFKDAESYHRSISPQAFLEVFDKFDEKIVELPSSEDDRFSPKIYHNFFRQVRYQPLLTLLEFAESKRLFEIQLEFSRILNCATVFFLNDFAEEKRVSFLSEQVFGVVNLGLDALQKERPAIISKTAIENIRFAEVYKVGLSYLYDIRGLAYKVPKDIEETLVHMNESLGIILQFLKQPLPFVPDFFREDGTFDLKPEGEKIISSPISSLQQIEALKNLINSQIFNKYTEIRSYQLKAGKIGIGNTNTDPQ